MNTPLITRAPMALALTLGLGLAACGSSAETATVTERVVTQTVQAAAPTTTEAAAKEVAVAAVDEEPAVDEETTTEEESSADDADCIELPDVTGMNHQEGQEVIRDLGLYNIRDKDATGQGRFLILDRNWVGVRQTPAGGTCVDLLQKITLYAKKIGE